MAPRAAAGGDVVQSAHRSMPARPMDRVARLAQHVTPAGAVGASAAADPALLGRPLAALPPSSRAASASPMPFWEDIEVHGLTRPRFPTLASDLGGLDCVVIGAGIVGLKLARHLAQYGLTVAVIEGSTIGDQAASARNQGCLQRTASDYLTYGADAKPMEELGLENRRMIRQQIEEYSISCDLLETPECSLVCAGTPDAEGTLDAMRAEASARQADGFACRFLDAAQAAEMGAAGQVNGLYVGGLCFEGDMAATFHSGKYLFGLAQGVAGTAGVQLFERSRAVAINDDREGTRGGLLY
jgi:hypothetical protein|eukprot:COSAG06_NODE_8456_length_2169_cov_1.575845_1_plen_299_part_00